MRLPATSPFDAAARRGVATLAAVSVLGGSLFGSPGEALAVLDAAATGKCVVSQCTVPLARCLTSPGCAANIACINTCTGKPDESECQIKCGDLFGDQASEVFNKCAVTDKKCVPQKQDDGSYPVPMASALAKGFKPSVLEGDWYISAGLNPAFDIFDCQLHRFETPSPTKLVGNLQARARARASNRRRRPPPPPPPPPPPRARPEPPLRRAMHHLVLIGDARAERGELTAPASARLSAPNSSDGASARAQFSDAPPPAAD